MSKKELGQFYTTNFKYILTGMYIPNDIKYIIEPFVGQGDLIKFLQPSIPYIVECYDIDPKINNIKFGDNNIIVQKKDTIFDPPNMKEKFVLTNPPYLSRNKSKNKEAFDRYEVNDLYKCHIMELINQIPLGGIIIIPLNFWSSIRKSDIELRKKFIDTFNIERVNIFQESVFVDTDYSVCSIMFNKFQSVDKLIDFYFYPIDENTNEHISIILNDANNYTIGGELFDLPQTSKYKIGRLIKGMEPSTNIFLKCIDDNKTSKLGVYIKNELFYDNTEKKSERSFATITITPNISLEIQEKLVSNFNKFIGENRTKYNSMFLSNYRENMRKRISFDFAFRVLNYLLYLEGY